MVTPTSPVSAPPSPMRSPTSPKAPVCNETVALQVTQFFDDWHYRVMRTSLGKTWTRDKVVISALELMCLNGVPLTTKDIKWMSELHDEFLIPALVDKMPQSIRENFDALASQLQMLLLTATRVRIAIDRGCDDIEEVMEEESHGVIKEAILKEAVIQASKEVAHVCACRDTWVKNTEQRLSRLTRSQALAEQAQAQLRQVEAHLECFADSNKAKTMKYFRDYTAASEKTMAQAALVAWNCLAVSNRAEREYRAKYEAELVAKECFLMQMREKAIENVKKALFRKSMEGDAALLGAVLLEWKSEIGGRKREAEEAKAQAELQAKIASFADATAANAKKVMARLGNGSDETALLQAFQGWVQAAADEKKERKLELEVKKAEETFKEWQAKKKEDANSILNKMGESTAHGLMLTVVQAWAAHVKDEMQARKIEHAIRDADDKFKSLKARQSGNASKVQTRVTEQMKVNLLIRILSGWELATKTARVEKYYQAKIAAKRKQLDSVRTLFRSFADKLDEGLGNIDGDSSGRDKPRPQRRPSKGDQSVSFLSRGDPQSVSLPDIRR